MPGFIKKTLHHIDAWQGTGCSSGSAYTRVLQRSEENTPLWIFERILNMPLVRKWQGYRNSV